MNHEIIEKAGDIIKKNTGMDAYCTLALIDSDGYPTASTITPSQSEGINWVTFCTGLGSNKVKKIENCNRASVCLNAADYNITLVGSIEVLTDPETKKDMWYSGLENHFSGPEDPKFCVLRFNTERYGLLIDWEEIHGSV